MRKVYSNVFYSCFGFAWNLIELGLGHLLRIPTTPKTYLELWIGSEGMPNAKSHNSEIHGHSSQISSFFALAKSTLLGCHKATSKQHWATNQRPPQSWLPHIKKQAMKHIHKQIKQKNNYHILPQINTKQTKTLIFISYNCPFFFPLFFPSFVPLSC